MRPDPYANESNESLVAIAQLAEAEYRQRHLLIHDMRDQRYGRTDVRSQIPEHMRLTDFEYHTPEIDSSILDLTSFLSAAQLGIVVEAPADSMATEANVEEEALRAVFQQGGELDKHAENEVPFMVWQHQIESGEGRYKLHLAQDYPLRMPQQFFADSHDEVPRHADLEDNPGYNPRARRATRAERGEARYRETAESLRRRREDFMKREFPWRWDSVDPATYFDTKVGNEVLGAGETLLREATILGEHGLQELAHDKDFVRWYGAGKAKDGYSASGSTGYVETIEFWTPTQAIFGVVSQAGDDTGRRRVVLSRNDRYCRWQHPYGRVPYYAAYGYPSTDNRMEYQYTGPFNAVFSEAPLVDHLETLFFNATHRQLNPKYQLVKIQNDAAPLAGNIPLIVDETDARRNQPPPGYKWEEITTNAIFDLQKQLEMARQRFSANAISAVLTGRGFASDAAAAQVSLVLGAAERAISALVRHHTLPMKQMMETFLRVNRSLHIDTHVNVVYWERDRMLSKPVSLKAEDIVQDTVTVDFNVRLPVDQASMEARGLALLREGRASYEHVAPRYLGIYDPELEKDRISFDRREVQIDEMAFRRAAMHWATDLADPVIADALGQLPMPEMPKGTIGGGPQGAYGGASAEMARGAAAMPGAAQVDS